MPRDLRDPNRPIPKIRPFKPARVISTTSWSDQLKRACLIGTLSLAGGFAVVLVIMTIAKHAVH